ncbi:hypothetical protein LARI1_G006097 [Lachnellula arida]|uniref:Small acidic protein n=1 Tax=Lachnellula arida TaxID=1316785 RepID=A0A8T9B3D2_9HELO|nr:hypothetical protein LARI1_G006097 [Lachnellula arida]
MADTNFISLGDVNEKQSFDTGEQVQGLRPPKVIGATKEERKEIARQIRLAAKKEKKKIKADAKRQRKENAAQHRRETKNTEKYNKNKDRNTQRAIDLERNKIRYEAVRQAERLAAKHDPSGKMFNCGEVIVLENGTVKSKEAWKRSQEAKAAREAGVVPPPNVNPERQGQILNSQGQPKKLSKKQQQKLAALNPKNVPPQPVLPEGIETPEGEENFIALWELDDKGIQDRINKHKKDKRAAAKALRRKQQEQKKFNRALKVKKKQAAHAGVLFDPEQAKREILGEMTDEEEESGSDDKAEEEDGSDDSDSSSDSGSDSDDEAETKEATPKSKKSKRPAEEPAEGQPDAKKSKSSSEPTEKKKVKKYNPPPNAPKINMNIVSEEDIAKRVKKEQHRVKLDLKRKAKLEKNIAEGNPKTLAAVGILKRNRKRDDETIEEKLERRAKRAEKKAMIEARRADPAEQERRARLKAGYAIKKEAKKLEKREARRLEKIAKASKKRKGGSFSHGDSKRAKTEESNGHTTGAEQWNPDALSGDAARKDKFMRLLGAGKTNGAGSSHKVSAEVDLEKVQNDLERQFDAGVRMKHEQGGKRRGLGA